MMKMDEWGEFFPSILSPFGYNETVAQEYYPLTRESVIARNEAIQDNNSNTGSPRSARDDGATGAKSPALRAPSLQRGLRYNWSDYEPPFPKVEKVIPASKLPENIKDIPDDILNWAIECEVTKKPFRIISQELDFYRKHSLPIPHRHPDIRHEDRMKLRNPRKLWERKCDKCGKEMVSTYSPEREDTVYCEECYEREFLG